MSNNTKLRQENQPVLLPCYAVNCGTFFFLGLLNVNVTIYMSHFQGTVILNSMKTELSKVQ